VGRGNGKSYMADNNTIYDGRIELKVDKEQRVRCLQEFMNEQPVMILNAEKTEVVFLNTVNNLCEEAYTNAKAKGWHDSPREMGTIIALIHSELSEALEADRKGDSENFVEELADVCIRIFDLCGSLNLDLESAIVEKMEYNKTRPYKHGKRY
jgi:NTP pyrophosphatase (non-canonical NTP hydrolase)